MLCLLKLVVTSNSAAKDAG